MKSKRSTALILSAILGTAYSIYLIVYFGSVTVGATSSTNMVGGAIATVLVAPHIACVIAAAVLNIIAGISNKPVLALISGILYIAGAVVFMVYALFVLPSIILSFVGYSKLNKLQAAAQQKKYLEQNPPHKPFVPSKDYGTGQTAPQQKADTGIDEMPQ
ncbi:MAG: hypothetical protein ACK5L3_03805 [Oscillospiraceae bacterium]